MDFLTKLRKRFGRYLASHFFGSGDGGTTVNVDLSKPLDKQILTNYYLNLPSAPDVPVNIQVKKPKKTKKRKKNAIGMRV